MARNYLLCLLALFIFSCGVTNSHKPLKYHIYSYTGSIQYDSTNLFRVDVYNVSDYLMRIELLTCRAEKSIFILDSTSNSVDQISQTNSSSYDTVSISLINVKTGVQIFL